MSLYRQSPEAQFATTFQLSLLEFARTQDQAFDRSLDHQIPELEVTEKDAMGDLQTYSFGGSNNGVIGANMAPKTVLWLQHKSQRNLSQHDFDRKYSQRLCDPYNLILYGTIGIVSAYRYSAIQGMPRVTRSSVTKAWGHRPDVEIGEEIQFKRGAASPLRRRLLERTPKPSSFDLLIEGQRIDTIFSKLGYSATRFSDYVSRLYDGQPELVELREEFQSRELF